MAFLHQAFIEKSDEMMKYLENLGYERFCMTGFPILFTGIYGDDGCFSDMHYDDVAITAEDGDINCIGNPSLFKAVAALQDDNDYMQWFTDGYHWECCPDESADVEAWMARYTPLGEKDSIPHKATLEELIEHFKTKTI